MARSYYIGHSGAVGASTQPQLGVAAPTAVGLRPRVWEFLVSSVATPADNATKINMSRFGTAAPTGAGTPTVGLLDSADPAQLLTPYSAGTAGSTQGTVLMMVSVNQRATFRWVAAPMKEFVIPNTNFQGVGIYSVSQSGAYNLDTSLYWEE